MARVRNKKATREAILAAARTVLGSDGPDALSLSKVANLAGVNRGTAYQHFTSRDDLLKATVDWVSDHLSTTVLNKLGVDEEGRWQGDDERPVYEVVARLVDFAVENPVLCRIWLFEVLSSDDPGKDRFFRLFKESTRELAESPYAQDGIDIEPLSVLMLAGYFLWPAWVTAHAHTEEEKAVMARRMRHEVLRLFLRGVLKPEKFPRLQASLHEWEENGR